MVVPMIKRSKHIEIVRSTQPGLSSLSEESCRAIFAVLAKNYATVGVTIVNNLSDLQALVALRPDLVFLGMKFIPEDSELGLNDPKKIWVAKYLSENNIAHTGSSHIAHELELNKPLAKQRVVAAGLKTSPFFVAGKKWLESPGGTSLPYPLFVKPANRGGGVGIDSDSVGRDATALRSKVQSIAASLQADSLVEEYLPGREFSVAILKNSLTSEFAVMPIELIAKPDKHGVRVLSEEVKSANSEQAVEVADKAIRAKVSELAFDVFVALGARDYGRVDIRLDVSATPHFLEANLIPSLISGYGSFPKACVLNLGLDYEPMILNIINLGLARSMDVDKIAIAPALDVALELA